MFRRCATTCLLAATLAGGGDARADADEAAPAALAAPTLLGAGELAAALALEAALDGDRADLAPDLWYGVSDRLTLGLSHSHRPDRDIGANRGLCLSGCLPADGRYNGIALSAHFPIGASAPAGEGGMRLVGITSTQVDAWSPAVASLVVGGVAEWHGDRFWAIAGPRLSIGLLGRASGNREHGGVNVTLGGAIAAPVAVEVGLGIDGPATSDFFAGAETPIWAQLVLRPRAAVGIGVAVGTSDVLGEGRRGYAALTVELRARPH